MAVLFDTVQVGPVKDGRQRITLPSTKKGVYVQCESSAEKVDEYLANRKSIEQKAAAREVLTVAIATLGGIIAGVATMKGYKMLEKFILGGLSGFSLGFLGALGFVGNAQNNIQKLNDEFIAQNSNAA